MATIRSPIKKKVMLADILPAEKNRTRISRANIRDLRLINKQYHIN